MARNKKKKAKVRSGERQSFSITEALGMGSILHNERLNFFFGLLLMGVAIYLALSFVSFFTTGAADQSLIEKLNDGELLNEKHIFANSCGSFGAYTAHFFVKKCFLQSL